MIRNYFINLNRQISRTSFVFILILIEVYFFVNGKAHFPTWDDTYGQLITAYLLMTVVFLLWSGTEAKKQMNKTFAESIGYFTGFFFVTYFLLFSATALSGDSITPIDKTLFFPTIIVQICVIATSEELMFRAVLLEKFGIIVSSLAFALWHSYAYGLIYYIPSVWSVSLFVSIGVAFTMGIVLAIITKKFGIAAAIGVHASYNLFVSGVFLTWSVM